MTELQRMTAVSRDSVIDRLRAMSESLPEGSFNQTALSWAADDMEKQIPGQVKYGGGAWRCFQCGAAVQPRVNHCGHCGKRLEWPQTGEEPQELYKDVKAVADDALTIDSETLPLVKRLRVELAQVKEQRSKIAQYEIDACGEYCFGDPSTGIQECEWLDSDGRCKLKKWAAEAKEG